MMVATRRKGQRAQETAPARDECECARYRFADYTCPRCERLARRTTRAADSGRVPDLVELLGGGR